MRRAGMMAVVVGLVASACGARTPLIVDETCHGEALPVLSAVPTIYLVLDHSLSMQQGDKWGKIRIALESVIGKVADRARFATVVFPTPGGDSCSLGVELMPPMPGGSPSTLTTFLTVTAPAPSGGTPTAATLLDLATKLSNTKDTFVLLATDGGPNCNANLSCSVGTCILNIEQLGGCMTGGTNCCMNSNQNCLDDKRAIDAVKQLKTAGISSYVVGIPGSDIYGPVLDAMAEEGGTARPTSPKYWRIDNTDALSGSLLEIANNITKRCAVTLVKAPKVPDGVRVSVRDVWRDRDTEWTLDGTTLTLLGQTCTDYDGDIAALHVEDGCLSGR